MSMFIQLSILSAGIWGILTGLIYLLALIARFYESCAEERTYYQLYLIPVIFYGLGFWSYIKDIGAGSVFFFLGGSILIILCLYLYHKMTASEGT